MAGDRAEGVEDALVLDPALDQVALDHPLAGRGVGVGVVGREGEDREGQAEDPEAMRSHSWDEFPRNEFGRIEEQGRANGTTRSSSGRLRVRTFSEFHWARRRSDRLYSRAAKGGPMSRLILGFALIARTLRATRSASQAGDGHAVGPGRARSPRR